MKTTTLKTTTLWILGLAFIGYANTASAEAGVSCESCKRSQHKGHLEGIAQVASAGAELGCHTIQSGGASFYNTGKITANQEHFNTHGLTAAHKTLKFGTEIRVVNKKTRKFVMVRVNDRGPFIPGRIVDLTPVAFSRIASLGSGHVSVDIQVCGSAYASQGHAPSGI